MDFITLASERYAVRKFSSEPIEKEKLNLVLKAGQLAPTACNYQPQRILVINNEATREKLDTCTPCRFNAPAALLVCYDKTVSWQRHFDGKNSGEVDACIVTTHMMLEATDIGLGSIWIMHFDPEKIKETFKIPDSFEPVVLLVIGYPADNVVPAAMHNQRVSLEHTVFYNSFS
jgi:nitroreductase